MFTVTKKCVPTGLVSGNSWILTSSQLEFSVDPSGRVIVEVHQIVRDMKGQLLLDRTVRHAYASQTLAEFDRWKFEKKVPRFSSLGFR